MAEFIKIDTLTNERFYTIKQRKLGLGEIAEISANINMGSQEDISRVLEKSSEIDVPFEEICTGDLKNMIIWSRVLTVDETHIPIEYRCSDEKCGYINPSEHIDINSFKKIFLDDNIDEVNEYTLEDGTKVTIELEKVKHLKIQKDLKNKIKDAQDKVIKITSLVKFEGKLSNSIERYNFLASPDNSDIAQELDYIITKKHFFGIYDLAFHKCPKCGRLSQVWLKFRHDSFSKLKYL